MYLLVSLSIRFRVALVGRSGPVYTPAPSAFGARVDHATHSLRFLFIL